MPPIGPDNYINTVYAGDVRTILAAKAVVDRLLKEISEFYCNELGTFKQLSVHARW